MVSRRMLSMLWLGWGSALLGAEPAEIHFESAVPESAPVGQGMDQAFVAVFQKLGIKYSTVFYPARRGIQELKLSRVDGSIGRIGDIQAMYGLKDLVRIDQPVARETASLWCRKEGLQKDNVRVGYKPGNVLMAMLVQAVRSKNVHLEQIVSYESFLQMVRVGRLDCMIASPVWLGVAGITAEDLQDLVRKDLITMQAFPWITRRLLPLKPKIEEKLRAYTFPPAYREHYLKIKPVCQNRYDLLCPDGVVFTEVMDFRKMHFQGDME